MIQAIRKQKTGFLGSQAMELLLADIAPIRCLDIGARGGPSQDVYPLGSAAEVYCFEPDKEECHRLNESQTSNSVLGSVRYFPVALGSENNRRHLHLTAHRGASSMLKPITQMGQKFSRPRYTTVEKIVEIETVPLDTFLKAENLHDISFMKIDVEGLELEIMQSASELLSSSLLAIRSEVAFITTREKQPTYADIDLFLRDYHFQPVGFAELHHWRRSTSEKHLKKVSGSLPFSRGEIIHGDMIFLRNPDSINITDQQSIIHLLKLAFIAMSYAFIDLADAILRLPEVHEYVDQHYNIDINKELKAISLTQAANFQRKRLSHLFPHSI
jgi:FkbM family methyltransferase